MKNVNSGSMVIPCLVNSKEVNEQEELIQYSPKPEPEAPTELVPVETEKRRKRCKQSEAARASWSYKCARGIKRRLC